MSAWGTSDRQTLVHFSERTIAVFQDHIQREATDAEAGGLLLGTVHGNHMLIEQATTPTKWDKRFRTLFERMPFGHRAIALSRWNASKGTVRYLGEWHTHPEDNPQPSGLDRSEWNRLAGLRQDQRSMLAVIVGRHNLYVELTPKQGLGPTLIGLE
ncbi:Mov34/MPN/PAD-1 family protein [Pseudoxanthomonas winnipegensis]|uniref:Mov34/MPN/PAD-1 family protein n=1 Tax=Pseudoxanthomonas winnipegensis TaxID=2480810 RepID=UPI0030F3B42E